MLCRFAWFLLFCCTGQTCYVRNVTVQGLTIAAAMDSSPRRMFAELFLMLTS